MSRLTPTEIEHAVGAVTAPWSWSGGDLVSLLSTLGVRAASSLEDELFVLERDGTDEAAGVVQSVESGGRVFSVLVALAHGTDTAGEAAADATAICTARFGSSKTVKGRANWKAGGLRIELVHAPDLSSLRFDHVEHRTAFDSGT